MRNAPWNDCWGPPLWTGVASAYFHASDIILGETLDLSGMFMFILSIAALQQYRSTQRLSPASLAARSSPEPLRPRTDTFHGAGHHVRRDLRDRHRPCNS